MKIAHLISNLSYGGAERQLLLLCRGLKESGHEVTIGSLMSGGELVDEFKSAGFSVREFGMKSAVDPILFFKVRHWLKAEQPDLLHTHLFKADVYGSIAASQLAIRTLSTKYNQDQYLKNKFSGWLARESANRCVRIIALSNAVRIFLIQAGGFDPNQIDVIPIGIERQEKLEARNSIKRFGVVARLVEQKGHSILLRAFKKVCERRSGLELYIYGSGPLEEELRDLTRKLHLESSVSFKGFVRSPEDIYTHVDTLILPSLWEGAGLALLEAMSRGIPVIASNVGGIPEIVGDGCGRLFPPGDENALAEAILDLAEHPQDFSARCMEQSLLFDPQRVLQMHLNLYAKLHK